MSFFGKGQGRKSVMIHTTFSHASLTSFNHKSGSTCITKTLKEGIFKLLLFINYVFGLVNNTRKHIVVTSVGKQ